MATAAASLIHLLQPPSQHREQQLLVTTFVEPPEPLSCSQNTVQYQCVSEIVFQNSSNERDSEKQRQHHCVSKILFENGSHQRGWETDRQKRQINSQIHSQREGGRKRQRKYHYVSDTLFQSSSLQRKRQEDSETERQREKVSGFSHPVNHTGHIRARERDQSMMSDLQNGPTPSELE